MDGAWRRWALERVQLAVVLAAGAVLVPLGLGVLIDATLGFLGRVGPGQTPALGPLGPLHWVVGLAALKSALRVLAPRLPALGPDPLLTVAVVARWLFRRRAEAADPAAAEVLRIAGGLLRVAGAGVCVPYAVLIGLLPAAGVDGEECVTAWRALYPVAVGNVIMVTGGWRAVRSLSRLHDAIRDSIYLVGRRLHNLE